MAKKAKKPAKKSKAKPAKKVSTKKSAKKSAKKPARKTSTVKAVKKSARAFVKTAGKKATAARKSGKKLVSRAIKAIAEIAAPIIPGGESKA